MKRKKQIKIRPFRIISYLFLYLTDIVLCIILRSYFLWLAVIIMTVCPLFSVTGLLFLTDRIQSVVRSSRKTAKREQTLLVEILLKNPLWYSALDCKIQLKTENLFYGTSSVITVSMPVKMHGESVLQLPVQGKDLGRICFRCESLRIQDMLGMIYCETEIHTECAVCIIPDSGKLEGIEITGFLSGAAETEESQSKGSDYAEVSDIREYIPGDRIRDIHWKLSAKQDILMVKERIAVAGSEIVVLAEIPFKKQQTELVLEMVYRLCQELIAESLPACLLCWNQTLYEFEEYRFCNIQSLDKAFCNLLRTPVSWRCNEGQEMYLKNCYPFLSSYLVVREQGGTVQVEMLGND